MITPTLFHEIQELLLTKALPALIKCLHNVSSMINSLRKHEGAFSKAVNGNK